MQGPCHVALRFGIAEHGEPGCAIGGVPGARDPPPMVSLRVSSAQGIPDESAATAKLKISAGYRFVAFRMGDIVSAVGQPFKSVGPDCGDIGA